MAHFRILALAALVFLTASSAAAADVRTISAERILEQIAAGEPVEYDGYTIEGALDLDRLDLPLINEGLLYLEDRKNLSGIKKEVGSAIRITNCIINGRVNFNNTFFIYSIDLTNSRFEEYAGFRGTVFKKGARLSGTQFFSYADFLGSIFNVSAYFNGCRFYGFADFEGARFDYANFMATFEDIADFRSTFFEAGSEFWKAGFMASARFSGARFRGNANFREVVFDSYAKFNDANFESEAKFDGVGFKEDADFNEARFENEVQFIGAKFNMTSDFRETTFNIADFTKAQFDKEAHFEDALFKGTTTFKNTYFKEDALFENATFDDELSLTRARYSKLFIRWHSIEKSGLAYDDAAYMSLMKNFKDLGYYEDYDGCYYAYRKAHRSVDWPSVPDWEEAIRKFIDRPLQWFYGYGTKPFHAFFWSLGIVMAFFFYWWWLGLGGPREKTKEALKDGEEWLDGDLTDILGYSVTVFLSGTRFFIDPPLLPKIEGRSRSWMKKAFILERVLGALFSVLFFIAISGTIVRAS